ncbi:hypothetical protein KQI49_05440 [Virgibacillus sp. MSJ-26]|uniref:hypothetical protein n=1 Tax=Virgibacillus sp. MSJ-26 TaxID=2841522 RepID=UPI001C103498|nr:hypothetical protein [Virgibacillus sp. MSJ-26]MBU5466275.1 hypothetical protein [Virgibacillus sp. MSJ-26]
MKRHVVIGFDARDHIAIGKVFEDFGDANRYLIYLNTQRNGEMIGKENRLLEYAEIFEMDYIPFRKSPESND